MSNSTIISNFLYSYSSEFGYNFNNFNSFLNNNYNITNSVGYSYLYNNQNLATVIDINSSLTPSILSTSKIINKKPVFSYYWAPSSNLNKSTILYYFYTDALYYIKTKTINSKLYINPKLYLGLGEINKRFFTDSFIALLSDAYNNNSVSSITLYNKNNYPITLTNLNLYVGTTSYKSNALTDPASISIKKNNEPISLVKTGNKYNLNSVTLDATESLILTLSVTTSQPLINDWLSTNSSILLIDLIGLLYTPVTYIASTDIGLKLNLSNNNFYYNNLQENTFNVSFKPTNINGETLNNQSVSLNIIDSSGNIFKSSIYSIISSGSTNFTIPTDYNLSIGNYTAYINYNPNDTFNSPFQATNTNPNSVSHYLEGRSNVESFIINKQSTMITNTTLNTSYSVLKEYTFTNFKLMDSIYISKDLSSTVTGTIKLTFAYPGVNDLTYTSPTGCNINNFSVNLKDIKLVPNRTYTLKIEFTLDNTDYITSPSILQITNSNFITEKPIINISQTFSDLSYFDTNTISVNFKDSTGNFYNKTTNNQGSLNLNIYNGTNTEPILSPSSFTLNTDNTIYTYSFSPEILNLLHNYSSSNYSIKAVYTETIIPTNITTSDSLLFTFKGVSIQQTDLSTLSNLNVYSSITLTTFLVDNKLIKSSSGTPNYSKISTLITSTNNISGNFKLYLGNTETSISPSTEDNINYIFTFTPNQLNLNTGNNPINSVNIKFSPTDASNIIQSYTIPKFDLNLITSTLTLTPKSTNNNYLYDNQVYDLTINGLIGKSDSGTLIIYKNDNITELKQYAISTNTTSEIIFTPFELLTSLSTIPSTISYKFGWTSINSNIYSTLESTKSISLSPEPITFSTISDYTTNSWGESYIITGTISTSTGKLLSGSIYIYFVNSESNHQKLVDTAYNLIESTNNFSISLNNNTPKDLTLFLKFVPSNTIVYSENQSNNFNVKFNKIEIKPTLNVYDLDLKNNADLTNPIFYTENLQIQLSNILLPSYKIDLYIGNNTSGNIFTYTDNNEIKSASHNIDINLFEYNSIKKIYKDETGPTYTIGYSINDYNDTLYDIEYTFPTIIFENSSASFKTFKFYDDNKAMFTNSLKLIYNKDYSIEFTFNSFKNSIDSLIPIDGKLYINIDNDEKLLNSNYIINTTFDLIKFNAKTEGLSTGLHNYYFTFYPSDPNINSFNSFNNPPSKFEISSSSIGNIEVLFSQNDVHSIPIYYQENFYTIINLNNPGLDGYFEVYCVHSSNLKNILDLDDVNNPSSISEEEDLSKDVLLNPTKTYISNKDKIGPITLNILCNSINQDITSSDLRQDYNIYIKFISTNSAYNSETFSYYKVTVYKIDVILNSLSISRTLNGPSLDYTEIIYFYTNETIYIKGSVNTINKLSVNGGSIDILTNYFLSSDYSDKNVVNKIKVSTDGSFAGYIILDTTSLLYLNSLQKSEIDLQFVYTNINNYNLTYFYNIDDRIPGYYRIKINTPYLDYTMTLQKSTNINKNEYYYQEDNITFIFTLPVPLSNFINTSLKYTLNLSIYGTNLNGDIFPYKNYTLKTESLVSDTNPNITIGTLIINPLIDGFPCDYNSYSIGSYFIGQGYNLSLPSNITEYTVPTFNVIKTIPKISVSIYSTTTQTEISQIHYENTVDLFIKVNTDKSVISGNSNSINGTFSVYLLIKGATNTTPSVDPIYFTYTDQTTPTDKYIFDNTNLSSNGITITFSPKDNLSTMEITNLSSIVGFYIDFTPADTYNYESKNISTAFTINKYSLTLSINSIQPYGDILTRSIRIDNPITFYNGYINYDEQFNVTSSINLTSVEGTYNYYYSSDLSTYTSIQKSSSSNDASNNLITTFSNSKIPIDSDNSYMFKVEFNPTATKSNYYSSAETTKSFNVYLANNFGDGTIAYYNNVSSSLIASYNSTNTINITSSFIFNDTVESTAKICSVKLYYTKTSELSNKILLTNEPKYLTYANNSATFNINSNILPTNLANSPYTIKALFTPVTAVNSQTINSNYPVIYEQSPLTLIVKPSLSIINLNSPFDYDLPISFGIKFNTGTSGTFNDYNKFNLSINGTSRDASNNLIINKNLDSIPFNPALITDNTISISNINLNPSLIPDTYTISIYANNDSTSISSTEVVTSSFIVKKFSVSLSGSIDKYYIKYGNPLAFTFNIGDYVIDNGFVNILFKNVSNSNGNKFISIPSNLLSKTGFNYTYTISDTSTFFSKSLPVGIYTLIYSLDNQNYTSVDYKDSTSNLFVNPIDCNLSLTYSATQITYGTSNNIVISADITTATASATVSTIISDAILYLTVNGNSTAETFTYNNTDQKYILTLQSTSLNIGINKICVYMSHSNYITNPVLKMITVTKGDPSTLYSISNSTSDNTTTNFKIVLNENIISGQTITFYTDITNTVINPESILESIYTFSFSDLLYGDNYIYAIINSPQFDTKTNSLKIVKPLKNVTITIYSSINNTYKSGTPLDIKYLISSSSDTISEGFVEFYRSFSGNTELIGVVNVTNGSASLEDYILYGDSDINNDNTTFKIYGKYIGTNKYNNSENSIDSVLTIFNQYASSIEIDSILYNDNEITSGNTLKVNSNIELNYKVTQTSPITDYTDGVIEFHSKYTDSTSTIIDEILGYSTLNNDFIGTFMYNLINIGTINIYAKYINANNYSDSNTSSDLFSIDVIKYYDAYINDLTVYNANNTYNINDSIEFSFDVKDNSGNLIKEGGVELHMISINLDGSNGDDDILNYLPLSNDVVNFTYYFYNSESYIFYGKFLNSNNYNTVSTNDKIIEVLANQTSLVSINYDSQGGIIPDNSYKLGDIISLYYSIIDLNNNTNIINDGSITIFKEYNYNENISSPEIIGMYEVTNGVAGTTYILNFNENFIIDGKNSVSFYATYGNSEIYSEGATSITKTSIYVIKQYNATISTIPTITPSTDLIVGDIVEIQFTVKNDNGDDVSDGILEFHKVYNNFDEIIGYSSISNANYINYTLVDNGNIYFYADFNNSINYANTTNLNNSYPVTITTKQQYSTSTTLTASNMNRSYGATLKLTADVNNLIIDDGNVNFYIVTTDPTDNNLSINEFIGSSIVDNGLASFDYKINKVGQINFSAAFKNSVKFADSNTTSNLNLTLSKASPTSINISYPATIHYLDIITITATVDFGSNLYFSNNGTVTFTINNTETYEVNLIKSDSGNTYIVNLEQIIYDKAYSISAKFNGNDLFTDIISSTSNIGIDSIIVNDSVYDGLTISYLPSSLTNYIILTATLNIIGTPNNKNVLNNTGYMTFEPNLNGSLTYTYPIINGSATANLPFIYTNDYEINVTYNDKDLSDISNNKITISNKFKQDLPIAIGGQTITTDNYKYHVFTSSDNITFTQDTAVDYLIVAGGGAGGSDHGGGGGAGGVRKGSSTILSGTYPVTVGSGGVLDYKGSEIMSSSLDYDGTFKGYTDLNIIKANKGGKSSVFSVESIGGGSGGGGKNGLATDGGSGGGSGGYNTEVIAAGYNGKGITGQGYNGGYAPGGVAGAGGGGSGHIGYDNNGENGGGLGGNGTTEFNTWLKDISSIMSPSWINATKYSNSGTDVYYIAGGGAGGSWSAPSNKGALGGGGNGGSHSELTMSTAGIDNTGSGGGGGGAGGRLGSKGGSGLVIIRYSITNTV